MIIKSFYEILEENLVGKCVQLRRYDGIVDYDDFTHAEDEETVIGWNENMEHDVWQGVVECILRCDNSHIDVIFDRNFPHIFPKGCLEDCYNWHMSDRVQFIESLDDILNQFEYNSKQILHFEKLNLELLEKHNNLTQLKPNL